MPTLPFELGHAPTRTHSKAYGSLQRNSFDLKPLHHSHSRHQQGLAVTATAAPREVVWAALTDYDGLAEFIPGLAENRCLERRPGGAQLLQVGEQSIALGATFRATVVLDIQEYRSGVPEALCSLESISSSVEQPAAGQPLALFPEPRPGVPCSSGAQDIAFSMVRGDFTAFRGIWRMQEAGPGATRLSYSLHVQPQPWLPVRLIQGRIEGEVRANLRAVRDFSEGQWQRQQGPP